ncbi:MAG: hypothetical protein HC888_12475 [Candidatus Competibacteraceae bacterium]|nr:hypothetical protein [Candidatus Competibacteraceae bacterium]
MSRPRLPGEAKADCGHRCWGEAKTSTTTTRTTTNNSAQILRGRLEKVVSAPPSSEERVAAPVKAILNFPTEATTCPRARKKRPAVTTNQRKGLRSPLLGGDDGDFEEMPAIDRGRGHGTSNSRPGRLRSPILGGSGDDFEDFDEEDDADDEPDENALRSPLLAVRAPRHEKPKAAPKPEIPPQRPCPLPRRPR